MQSNLDTSSLSVSSSLFSHSGSKSNGAVLLENVNADISGCQFAANSAVGTITEGDGGALFLSCPTRKSECHTNVSNSRFVLNRATHSGGAITWTDCMPTLTNVSFEQNWAPYGPDLASFAIAIRLTGEVSFQDVPSGQSFPREIVAVMLDHYGQILSSDNSSVADLRSENLLITSISGETRSQAIMGRFRFKDFSLAAQPGSNTTIKIKTNGINVSKDRYDPSNVFSPEILLPVHMRSCVAGESLLGDVCFVCPEGKYSLNPNDTCSLCPDGGICFGNSTMAPRKNYWRSSNETDAFWLCPNPDACLGSPDGLPIAPTGLCLEGYYSNMCHGCIPGFSRNGKHSCARCPDTVINAFQLTGIAVGFLVILVFIIKASLKTAHQHQSHSSVFLKIFVNYLQLTATIYSFDMNWPQYVQESFKANESASNVSSQLFSFDCFIDFGGSDNQSNTLFLKLIVVASMPVLIVCVSILFWGAFALVARKSSYVTNQLVNSIVVLFFVAHPSLVSFSYSMFDCRQINQGEYWLNAFLNIRCWDGLHSRYAMLVALPSLLLWGLAVPFLALLLLGRNKRYLEEEGMRIKLGFLYSGYNTQRYYWEFVIMYRKMAIITMGVFLSNSSTSILVLCVFLILAAALILHVLNTPYTSPVLNDLEKRSILVSAITIYCGLFYMTKKMNSVADAILFSIMILANAYFLVYWLVRIFEAGLKLLLKRFPLISKAIKTITYRKKRAVVPDFEDSERSFSMDRGPWHTAIQGSQLLVPNNSVNEAVKPVPHTLGFGSKIETSTMK